MTDYQKYQLQWMINHKRSLDDLIYALTEQQHNSDKNADVTEIFWSWENDIGFGGEIWACEDEWKENEGKEMTVDEAIDYMLNGHLPNCVFDGEVTRNGDELLCSTECVADMVAEYIDELCGAEVSHTGYYDPDEDERDNCVDECTGYWYVDFD